jgi:hypothetical protein
MEIDLRNGNGRWKRDEQPGSMGEMGLPRRCSAYRKVVRWLPRKVCGEHGRIVIFSDLTEYVRGLKRMDNA